MYIELRLSAFNIKFSHITSPPLPANMFPSSALIQGLIDLPCKGAFNRNSVCVGYYIHFKRYRFRRGEINLTFGRSRSVLLHSFRMSVKNYSQLYNPCVCISCRYVCKFQLDVYCVLLMLYNIVYSGFYITQILLNCNV